MDSREVEADIKYLEDAEQTRTEAGGAFVNDLINLEPEYAEQAHAKVGGGFVDNLDPGDQCKLAKALSIEGDYKLLDLDAVEPGNVYKKAIEFDNTRQNC